jgi:phosphate acetyltransferase
LALFEQRVDGEDLLDRVALHRSPVMTPLRFENELLDRARADRRHIVLPEGSDEPVLRAAETLLRREVVDVTLLGAPDDVRALAARLGVDVTGAALLDPRDEQLRERFAHE